MRLAEAPALTSNYSMTPPAPPPPDGSARPSPAASKRPAHNPIVESSLPLDKTLHPTKKIRTVGLVSGFARFFQSPVVMDKPRVGDIVNPERRSHRPQIQACIHEVGPMRDGIRVVINLRITLHLAQVIARVIDLSKGIRSLHR